MELEQSRGATRRIDGMELLSHLIDGFPILLLEEPQMVNTHAMQPVVRAPHATILSTSRAHGSYTNLRGGRSFMSCPGAQVRVELESTLKWGARLMSASRGKTGSLGKMDKWMP